MDTLAEARDYDAMDHAEVNRRFVDDLLAAAAGNVVGEKLRGHAATLPHAGVERLPCVLDVGTGTAQIPIELCRRPAACRVTAIDLSREMLKLAERNIAAAGFSDRIGVQLVDARRLPFGDGAFDAVISNSIVHHIPDPEPVLAEMRRVVRPEGLLFVRDLLRPADSAAVEALVAMYAGHENEHSRAMFRASLHAALTLDEVRQLLGGLGLPHEAAQRTSDRHWTVRACGF
ncbi:MAG TPA: class I SAM-dependent methyltransferase [Planctomycetaceae bacterium]|nr:class I SAM-dependent methyltransferase [Planctomycetaceae bacterium]